MKGMLYVSVIVALLSSQGVQKQVEKARQVEPAKEVESMQSNYGSAVVSSILQLDQHGLIYCNIEGFPAVVGQNMPVQIKGLKPSANPQDNLPILRFLNELLLSEKDKPEHIELKHIQRGSTAFCLLADVEVDGQDPCDLLVDKGLVKRVIEVPSSLGPGARRNLGSDATRSQPGRLSASTIVASKTSKIYHRPSCMHARRMDEAKMITFTSSAEADKTGRRPCKTCKP